ncbi:hypothetical protein [Mycobacterium sp.]|uniref:hypothetical protein n=1 Tax=Mycobacterium sp. TaxID=1785 RepID=UPI00127A935C|nr:hypothetical protein [Mycobacterium sp.]KAA8969225.1 MAG: hypothetical protein F6Q13_03775 [Mycobacterium sp.]
MPTIWTLLRATAVVLGGSAALLAGGLLGTAHADPAPPIPAPNIGQQLLNTAASAPQMLQSLATALGATPPAPATPPPLASAAIQMPQLPQSAAAPGATSAVPGALPGATSLLPGAPTPAAGPAQLVPSAQLGLPQVPFLPVPLPQQVSLPGDLASLATGGIPLPRGAQPGTTPASAPGMAPATGNVLMAPLLSALP